MKTKSAKIIVLSGPTGSGESAITKRILEEFPRAERIITTTSRPPRPYEKEGVDYYFVSPEEFHHLIERGDFLEYIKAPFRDVYYGTLRRPIEEKLNAGIHLIGNLGWPGHESFSRAYPGRVFSIFIKPDDLSVIRKRLIDRDPTITHDEVAKRIQNAELEMQDASHYDAIVINKDGKMEETVAEIRSIMEGFLSE